MLASIIGMCLLGLACWLVWVVMSPSGLDVRTEMPERLKNARTWAKEKPFWIDEPVGLTGRLDEAYEERDGTIVLSETKSRARQVIYNSDILQLSAYKMVIEQTEGRRVSDTGYVRLITGEGNVFKEVRLLDHEEVVAATKLHEDLKAGSYKGEKCGKVAVCRKCSYKRECDVD